MDPSPELGELAPKRLALQRTEQVSLIVAPSLDRILAGYHDTVPLAAGWRSRIPLHQLHPLLVHACLFGASYRDAVRSAARAVLDM